MTRLAGPEQDVDSLVDEIIDVKLNRDLRKALRNMSKEEGRLLVDAYYQVQGYRMAFRNQARSVEQGADESVMTVLSWLGDRLAFTEGQIKAVLTEYGTADLVSVWAQSITGIGPVIASGLKTTVDIHKAPTVGHIWRFAGLDPTLVWEKGKKRPFNAELRTLCFKIGESFVKVQNRPSDVYGKVFAARKALEQQRNEEGAFAEQAARIIASGRFQRDTGAKATYESGKLPPSHIHARARRYTVKLFLSAYHEVAYFVEFGKLPPLPYVIEHLGHADYYGTPNAEYVPGLLEAYQSAGRPRMPLTK